ncbi:MAG: penicillin acylase family protein [Melioribacteraceae bacterium]|nr:penicillin acylase family protein [Melioribacteraceae bacterium]MCF8264462.1 penicillin acylase family protein [Melioribacteraceae bacterium]
MKKLIKIGSILFGSVIVLILAFILITNIWLDSTLPEYTGEVQVYGLNQEVEILRDSSGFVYINALNINDAAFSLGYVHAQERLFQMDLTRRAGEGRLSEILGPATLPFDRMFRTVGIHKHVMENLENYMPETMELLQSYADGVNQFIEGNKNNLSFEFDLLGYDPYLWKPEHSLMISKLMAWELNMSWWTDFAYIHIMQKLGVEKTKEIIPDYDENAPTIIPESIKDYPPVSLGLVETDKAFRKFMGFTGTHIGSNNWVVNAAKSESGKPIIANDPHLAFQAPGKWFYVSINSPDWKVAGFTLPGAPVVVIGVNENIAWAMTNVMADDADFYLEKLDEERKNYFVDGIWKSIDVRFDTITVKDSTDSILKIEQTHRGPIISGIHPYDVLYNTQDSTASISMRWSALDFSDELFAMYSLNRSKNSDEIIAAIKNFSAPGQNFVYADKAGNIGYICGARLPLRKSQSPTLIFDGTISENDWLGNIPYEEMPKLFNPPQDFIASANNKTVRDFPYHISNVWEPPSRIERINELLRSKKKHSVQDFQKYQTDFKSKYAEKVVPYILEAFKNVEINDENLNMVLLLLRKWNFEMEMMSQTPTIYNAFLTKFIENILLDEMGEELLDQYRFVANVPYRIVLELLGKGKSVWFDDINTPEYESMNTIIRKSLVDAISELEENFGDDVSRWQWGEIHSVTFKHLFGMESDLIGQFVNVGPFPLGGDGTTVFNTEYSFNDPFDNNLGPSMRYVYDFAEPDYINLILPTGQSGNFRSDYYSNMTEKWLNGELVKIPLWFENLNGFEKDRLILQPE